jgi:hypothetical protein
VIGAVAFAAGLAGAAVAVPLGERLLREHGFHILPVPMLTELRVVAGTAALAAAAVLAAIQQSLPRYPQVSGSYTPFNGYFPLAPWAGLAVLCGWAVLALGLAVIRLGRTDASAGRLAG